MSETEQTSQTDDQTRTPEEIEAEIETTREGLGDTVEALAEKTDVKAQAKARAADVKASAQETASTTKAKLSEDPRLLYGTATALAILVLIGIRRRRG